MKIPLNWLKDYIKIEKNSKEIAESFTLLGLLLDKPATKSGDGKNETTEILDLEHRMDRADWLSVLGCARDLAAFESLPLNYPQTHTQKGKEGGGVRIEIQCPDLINRFNTRVFKNVKVGPSPSWLKERLEAYGIAGKNNIVDITNFVMVEYGQPMHAQDLAKMEKPEIAIRRARQNEEIVTLLGETVKLDEQTFVLTQNDKPTVIGGIVGGKATAVDETTTSIVLDAGNYNQVNVRNTSRRLKIQNETVLRYDKFLHPHLTELAIQRATYLILELAGGEYYENADWYPTPTPLKQMTLRKSRLYQLSGMEIELTRAKEILTALEYKVLGDDNEKITVEVPYFRTDVEVEDDLVADVLRINNYEKIPVTAINIAPPAEITPAIYKFEDRLRDIMVTLGAHEHITDPLVTIVAEASVTTVNPLHNTTGQIVLQNALTAEKAALRTTIYETLKKTLNYYKKHKLSTQIQIFEVGKVYRTNDRDQENAQNYEENQKTAANYTEERVLEYIYSNETLNAKQISDKTKQALATVLNDLGIINVTYSKTGDVVQILASGVPNKTTQEQENTATAISEPTSIGELKIDSFSLKTEELLKFAKENNSHKVKHAIFNHSEFDLAIVGDQTMPFGPVYNFICAFNAEGFGVEIAGVQVIEEFVDSDRLGEDKKSVLMRVLTNNTAAQSTADTQTTSNASKLLESLIKSLEDKFNVKVRV